ncbi:hypothetical protein pb186bvf_009490 [Paramecium bursaria]
MDQIILQPILNYGSNDQTPSQRIRPLGDNPKGRYKIFSINRKRIFILGPHWTLFVAAYSIFTVFAYMLIKRLYFLGQDPTFGIFISVAHLIMYFIMGISEPGISDNQLNEKFASLVNDLAIRPQKTHMWYCYKCQCIQPERSYHCDFCEVCIKNYDHHCPWTGKCIGEGNIIQFYIFICTTIGFFTYFISIEMR